MKNPRQRGGCRGLVGILPTGGFLPKQLLPHDLHGGGGGDSDPHVIRGDSVDLHPDLDSVQRQPNPFAELPAKYQHPCISIRGIRGLRDRATLYRRLDLGQPEKIPFLSLANASACRYI